VISLEHTPLDKVVPDAGNTGLFLFKVLASVQTGPVPMSVLTRTFSCFPISIAIPPVSFSFENIAQSLAGPTPVFFFPDHTTAACFLSPSVGDRWSSPPEFRPPNFSPESKPRSLVLHIRSFPYLPSPATRHPFALLLFFIRLPAFFWFDRRGKLQE